MFFTKRKTLKNVGFGGPLYIYYKNRYVNIWISQNLQSWAEDHGSHLAVVESSAQALRILPFKAPEPQKKKAGNANTKCDQKKRSNQKLRFLQLIFAGELPSKTPQQKKKACPTFFPPKTFATPVFDDTVSLFPFWHAKILGGGEVFGTPPATLDLGGDATRKDGDDYWNHWKSFLNWWLNQPIWKIWTSQLVMKTSHENHHS